MNNMYEILAKLDSVTTKTNLAEGVYKDVPDRSKIPAMQRKAAGEQPLTLQDLERERTKSPTTPEGMRALQDKLRKQGHMEETMTPKQKKFAALAEPRDKITFADKIAGAKKEVDEMLGDVAAKAMRSAVKSNEMEEGNDFTGQRLAAIRAGKPTFKVGNKTYRVSGDTSQERGMSEARDDDDDDYYGIKTRSHKTASGGTVTHSKGVTRHQAAPGRYGGYNPETDPDKDDDKPDTPAGEKRGRGRPKKTNKEPERVTAKAYKHKGGRKVKEEMGMDDDMIHPADQGEYDREGDMADEQLHTIEDAAKELQSIIDADDNLPEWVQSKITKAMDYIDTARDYMHSKGQDSLEEETIGFKGLEKQLAKNPKVKNPGAVAATIGREKLGQKEMTRRSVAGRKDESLEEKAVSGAQQMAAAIALKAKRSGHKPKAGTASAQMAKMPAKELEKFASTKRSDLPKHVSKKKEESVEETTVAGSVAPGAAPAKDPGAPKEKKAKGGMVFGKGVYEAAIAESFNKKLSSITESMSINVSASDDGTKNVTVNASDEDAVKLAEILKLAGMGSSEGYSEVCPACGQEPCACDHIDEELANSPNPVTTDEHYMTQQLSGGLNGPKTTGQTTIPVLNRDPRRQVTMSEQAVDTDTHEKKLWELYARYQTK